MNILELFAGSQSFSKVAKVHGFNTFTSDIQNLSGIDYVTDIMNFDVKQVPFIPDLIWCSPDCATWSKAAGKIHFDSKSLKPKTEKAKNAFLHIAKMMEVIFYFLDRNKNLKFYIENPEGKLQKFLQASTLFNQNLRLIVLDQCQYGREHQKTTHIFTNDFLFVPAPRCKGLPNCHHLPNIKSMKQGAKSSLGNLDGLRYYECAKIPVDLCNAILKNYSNAYQL